MGDPRWHDPGWHDPAPSPSRGGAPWPDPGPYDPASRGRAQGFDRRQPSGRIRPWGTLPGRTGIILVAAVTALGALLTVVTGGQPGLLLGVFLVAGTAVAGLAVAPRAGYQIIPVPAMAYVAAAILAVLASGQAAGTSRTALALTALQAIAGGFDAMIAATLLAIVIAAVRWRRVGPNPRTPGYQPPTRETGRPGRPGRLLRPSRRADDGLSALRGLRQTGDQRATAYRSSQDPGRDL